MVITCYIICIFENAQNKCKMAKRCSFFVVFATCCLYRRKSHPVKKLLKIFGKTLGGIEINMYFCNRYPEYNLFTLKKTNAY